MLRRDRKGMKWRLMKAAFSNPTPLSQHRIHSRLPPRTLQNLIYHRRNLRYYPTHFPPSTLHSILTFSKTKAGFSFSGEIREPFPSIISALEITSIPVLAVDAPSSWNITSGPPEEGPGAKYQPEALISLTAPKPLVEFFGGRHFVGGR